MTKVTLLLTPYNSVMNKITTTSLNPMYVLVKNRISWTDISFMKKFNGIFNPVDPIEKDQVYYLSYARTLAAEKNTLHFAVVVVDGDGVLVGVAKRDFSFYQSMMLESVFRQFLFLEKCIFYSCTSMNIFLEEKNPITYSANGRLMLNVNWNKMRRFEMIKRNVDC